MPRRKRDRTGDRLEAGLKLVVLAILLLSFAIGGVKNFSQVFGSLVSGLLVLALIAAAITAIGFVVSVIRRKRSAAENIWASTSPETSEQVRSRAGHSASDQVAESPNAFSHELLHTLEWKRFEQLASHYFELLGFRTDTTRVGADGGIDIKLFNNGEARPAAIVQCKAWNAYSVGVKPIRELYGVMAAEGVPDGVFLTTSTFTSEAKTWAEGKSLELIDASLFLGQIRRLPSESQKLLLERATAGNFTTPTCPSCGIKMSARTANKGRNAGSKFWGCRNYPRCKQTFQVRRESESAPSRPGG